jgi:hypothetical protein
MKEQNNNLDELFNSLNGQWDTEEPELGHHGRFLNRLEGKNKQRSIFKIAVPVAAAVAILMGLFIILMPNTDKPRVALNKMSPKTQEAQMYFTSIIQKELAKVEKENTPETKMLVTDAISRMQKLETDYNKLVKELEQKGESKQLIHAMITNLQTRISFLEEVMTRIENIKKFKENRNENNS